MKPKQRKRCFAMSEIDRMSDTLRQAVAYRIGQGKLGVLSAVTGVPEDALLTFAETGEIDQFHRMILEVFR